MSNPLDDNLNNDFVEILSTNPLLAEAWQGLPESQRAAVLDHWNGFSWDMILAGAKAQDNGLKEIPLQLGFNHDLDHHYGYVRLMRPLEKQHEYVISPIYNSYTGEIVSYALTHRTRVMSKKLLDHVLDQEAKHAPEPET
jgi:hypothetical protein